MRTFAWLAAAFSGAIFLSVYLLPTGIPVVASVIFLLCAVAAFFLRRRGRTYSLIFLIAAGMCAGCCWFGIYSDLVYNRVAVLDETEGTFTVTVAKFAEESTYGARVDAYLEDVSPLPVRVRLYGDDLTYLTPGDVIQVQARCSLADTLGGEQTDVFTAKGVFAFLYADGKIQIEKDCGFSVRWAPQYLSRAMREKVSEIFQPSTTGIFHAMLMGDQSELYDDPGLLSSFRIAGVYHILVVSGMHLSFLTGILTSLFGRRKLALVACIPILVLFAAMVGFGASVTRALIMQIFVLVADLANRENDRLTSLAAALALILVQNPYAAAGAGLQLSFAATLGILLFSGKIFEKLYARLKNRRILARKPIRRIFSGLISLFATSVGANLLTIPLVALYYGNVSLISPITNLLTMWAFSFAFTLGFYACLIGFIWTQLGCCIAWCASLFAQYARLVVQCLAQTPLAAIYTTNVYVVIWLVYVYVLFLVYVACHHTRRMILPLSLATLSLCAVLMLNVLHNRSLALGVTVLDVGQGQCLLFSSDDATVMVDCGSSSYADAGAIAAEYMLGHGMNGLELLVFTHGDADHSNGFAELAARIHVETVLLPPQRYCQETNLQKIVETAEAYGIEVLYVEKTLAVEMARVTLRIMPPAPTDVGSDKCVSVLCTVGTFDVLVTGDMDQADEIALLRREQLPDLELLVVGHHGSKYSTSEELLLALRPETAVISVGYNRYGHPASETLERLNRYCTKIYRTDQDGTVTIFA